jgi:hypothetical protein
MGTASYHAQLGFLKSIKILPTARKGVSIKITADPFKNRFPVLCKENSLFSNDLSFALCFKKLRLNNTQLIDKLLRLFLSAKVDRVVALLHVR